MVIYFLNIRVLFCAFRGASSGFATTKTANKDEDRIT